MGGRRLGRGLTLLGEVRWYQFAAPDKRRPVVILTRDSFIPSLGEVTVAPALQSNVPNLRDLGVGHTEPK